MTTTRPLLNPAHIARIELAYAAHLRALHSAFGITPVVVNYDYDRDYLGLPDMPHDLQLRAPLEGGLVIEAHEDVPGKTGAEFAGLFSPRGEELGQWCVRVARWETVDQRPRDQYGLYDCPPRIKVGLWEIAGARSTDRSPHSLAQAVGTALHSAVGRSVQS